MKISVGMIVFNALSTLPKDMLLYCIDNMYDIADEFFIVEGATKCDRIFDGDTSSFTNDGRSTDGTLEYLYDLNIKYTKLRIITKEGFWNGKTEMCNSYAKLATGDYVWQLDSDEFYKKEDQKIILGLLNSKKPDLVQFYVNQFFGDFNHVVDERYELPNNPNWANKLPWNRIFKNNPNNSYWRSHEPPIYVTNNFECNNGNVINRNETLKLGIKLYHYSCVIKEQIDFKSKFFRNEDYITYWNDFQRDKNTNVFGDKIYEFTGNHPNIIKNNYLR